MSLMNKKCTPCQGGIPPLSRESAESLLQEIPQWQLSENADKISRQYRFGNFVKALEFVNEVGELAEREMHHPDIQFGWGYCTVIFYTHKIHGLHENDFILAAKTESIYEHR
ncbi:MAG: 4a-hydroxytetrahydrobiopterin dehydratase [Gammaproteobacteria bacterium]|nr:4a-hydroxytetrahydrobiopterin dehydratase [Gammaproteobacteria bacterium]MDH5691796.1 4a-hydroxytetrahydrobiopterin dehydratase [Gammaproteobacteria bacterium]